MTTSDPQDGFTLVEVLVAVAILGIAFAVLLVGMRTSILGSDIHRQEATAGAVLVQAAEAVKDDNRNAFLNCSTIAAGAAYNPYTGVMNLPDGWAASGAIRVVSVEHWNGSTFVSACSNAWKLQRIKLAVTSKSGRAEETVTLVKAGL